MVESFNLLRYAHVEDSTELAASINKLVTPYNCNRVYLTTSAETFRDEQGTGAIKGYDFLILDNSLAGEMKGVELAFLLRAGGAQQIIVLNSTDEFTQEQLALFDYVLPKPAPKSEVIKMLIFICKRIHPNITDQQLLDNYNLSA